MRKLIVVLLAAGLSGCALFEDALTVDHDGAAAAGEKQSLMELSIETGRYGVMLGQAREILKLPEPKVGGDAPGAAAADDAQERAQLAKVQVQVAGEFIADTARACQKRKLPKGIRSLACAQQKTVPAEFRIPVAPEVPALASRNDKMGAFIMDWWGAVCATAPKSREGEVSACAIE